MKPAIKFDAQLSGQSSVPANHMRRVLVVDDEENVLELLKSVLETSGFKVTAVPSAEQAWPLHLQKPFELVITDVRLGGMDGFELMNRKKSTRSAFTFVRNSGVLATLRKRHAVSSNSPLKISMSYPLLWNAHLKKLTSKIRIKS